MRVVKRAMAATIAAVLCFLPVTAAFAADAIVSIADMHDIYGGGGSDYWAALWYANNETAAVYAPAGNATLLFPAGEYYAGLNNYLFAYNQSPTNTLKWAFEPGAKLVTAGYDTARDQDITIYMYNIEIDAGREEIFGGTRAVQGSIVSPAAYPEWFGAAPDDDVDDVEAIEKIFNLYVGSVAVGGDVDNPGYYGPMISPSVVSFASGSYDIKSDMTVPSSMTLYFESGAMLTIADGVTLTINGSVTTQTAQQVFYGEGSVGGDIIDNSTPGEWLLWTEGKFPHTETENPNIINFTKGITEITENTVYDENTLLDFENGALMEVPAGVTVTINGTIKASLAQIFSGDGVISGHPNNPHGYPQWFGARGDGVTDDSEAVAKAAVLFSLVKLPKTNAGYVIGNVLLSEPVVIEGDPAKTTVRAKSGADFLFLLAANGIALKNLKCEMGPASEGSSVFLFSTATTDITNARLSNIETTAAFFTVADNGGSGQVKDAIFSSFRILASRCSAFTLTRFTESVTLKDTYIEGGFAATGYPLISVAGARSITLSDLILDGGTLTALTGAYGVAMVNTSNSWVRNVYVRNTGDSAFSFTSCANINCRTLNVQNTTGSAIYLDRTEKSHFSTIRVSGVAKYGISINGGRRNQFTDIYVAAVDGGIVLTGTSLNSIMNVMITTPAAGRGYTESGQSDYNLLIGASIWGMSQMLSQTGKNSVISDAKLLINGVWTYETEIIGKYE